MSSARKTFYEVLGVKRRAKADEIARAYARLRAEMQKETTAPDARLAAMAKVAYATLSDPDARAEYDESLGMAPARPRITVGLAASIVALVAAAGVAYYFLIARSSGNTPAAPPFDVPRLLDDVGSRVGRVQAALVSGEVRDLGLAVETGENEMLTTCRGIEAGMSLTIREGKADLRAEVARADSQDELCTLSVKGAREAVKLRSGTPSVQETLQAVLPGAAAAEAKPVTVARLLNTPHGPAFTLRTKTPLPNGTPLFDSREQLAGVVISPHDQGEGIVLALAASRVEAARASAANAAPSVAASPTPRSSAESTPEGSSAAAPSVERRAGEMLVAEGFTTLWKE
ncbi:MAG TPA: DnaJ domain-containing protein, partial [Usitatibacter sp.]|nr:DnaJ domain-containing protein [Usitatibacter sp.]